MKKLLLVFAAAFACLAVSGTSFAGVCINVGACNDYYFSLGKTESPQVYSLTGYEYGCGQVDRIASGTARVSGGQVHVGFTGTNGLSSTGGRSAPSTSRRSPATRCCTTGT